MLYQLSGQSWLRCAEHADLSWCPQPTACFEMTHTGSSTGLGCAPSWAVVTSPLKTESFNHFAMGSFAGPLKCIFTQPYSSPGSLKKVFPKLNINIQLAGGTHGICSVAWKITLKISMSAL